MKEEDIIKIVKALFKSELNVSCEDPYVGGEINGKDSFFNELELKLKKLFDENDLSK